MSDCICPNLDGDAFSLRLPSDEASGCTDQQAVPDGGWV